MWAKSGPRTEYTCIKEMLEGGHIEPSDSPWASLVVLVTTKDGSTHFCVDYSWLNSLTVKDAYPLPHIDDSLCLLGNQQWFSNMNLPSGYWQVAMSAEAKWKAAFVTHEGLYQFHVIPFVMLQQRLKDLWTEYFVARVGRAAWYIPGRCDFVWHDCSGGVAMLGGGAGAIECIWVTT